MPFTVPEKQPAWNFPADVIARLAGGDLLKGASGAQCEPSGDRRCSVHGDKEETERGLTLKGRILKAAGQKSRNVALHLQHLQPRSDSTQVEAP